MAHCKGTKFFDKAIKIFKGAGAQITVNGTQHLSTVIGSKEYKQQVSEKVQNWMHKIEHAYDNTKAFSHEIYAGFVFSYVNRNSHI